MMNVDAAITLETLGMHPAHIAEGKFRDILREMIDMKKDQIAPEEIKWAKFFS